MATGDSTDVTARLFRWLPTRWFPTGSGTRVYATMVGFSSALSAVYQQVVYVRLQARLGTVTDGFADLASYDYLANELPRIPGETDPAYVARIKANIFLAANTRAAIIAAVEGVTGQPARVIEPWQPNDTFVWGRSFWGVNTRVNPGQWANGNQRYKGLVVCSLPAGQGGGNPRFGWGNFFWATGPSYAVASGSWWGSALASSGIDLIISALKRVKVFGTSIYIQIVPPGSV